MARPTPSQALSQLSARPTKNRPAVALGGFVAPSPAGTVRLCPSQSLGDCIDIPEESVLRFEQDADSGVTHLFVDFTAVVSVVATRSYPISALVAPRLDNDPDAGAGKTCTEKRQEKCRSDPTVSNKDFCDSPEGERTFKLLCDLFGDPAFGGFGGDIVIV